MTVIKGKTISSKDWECEQGNDDLVCRKKDSRLTDNLVYLQDSEKNWQPASIQIAEWNGLKKMEESGSVIFFKEDDLKKKKWENRDLP